MYWIYTCLLNIFSILKTLRGDNFHSNQYNCRPSAPIYALFPTKKIFFLEINSCFAYYNWKLMLIYTTIMKMVAVMNNWRICCEIYILFQRTVLFCTFFIIINGNGSQSLKFPCSICEIHHLWPSVCQIKFHLPYRKKFPIGN